MTHDEFNARLPLYENTIAGIARKLARSDNDLKDDLYNLGLIAMWRLDLTQCRGNEEAFIATAARSRMIDYLRKQKNYKHESLEALLNAGFQVKANPDTGEAELVTVRRQAMGLNREDDPDYGVVRNEDE